MAFKAAMKVRFSDVDNAGIVYYPRFFHYFHVAFEELFSEHFKLPYPKVLGEDKVGFPVVSVKTDFHVPIAFGDVIEIEVMLERLGTKSATFYYQLRKRGDDTVRAEAHVTVANIDMETFRAVPFKDKYRTMLEDYLKSSPGPGSAA